ncbi:hypothetical protein SHKM778_49410 [Streptomyces sp. KM77-8]|uniref:Nitroreductase domain-containing protein n=1 Tax=Streptomyces haneummycinicus TaxID=3074435 RepID=A0AAT9HM91_9ACTN
MQTREVDATAVQALLAAAVAAPSIHNTQPWRFGLDPDSRSILVRVDRRRQLPTTDPQLRAQYLSVGAAVFNLRVAAEHLGWHPVVRLCPAGEDPDVLATVRLTGAALPGQPSLRALHAAIERRHTSRMPFTGRPVPDSIVGEMTASARAEGARLDVPDIVATRRLLRLTAAAESRNTVHSARAAESRTWITAPGADAAYGIPCRPWARGTRPGGYRCGTSPARCPPRTCPPCASNAMPRWPCCGRPTTGATTGCAPGRPWSGYCSRRPRTECGPRYCTRPWSGRTCGRPWPDRGGAATPRY